LVSALRRGDVRFFGGDERETVPFAVQMRCPVRRMRFVLERGV